MPQPVPWRTPNSADGVRDAVRDAQARPQRDAGQRGGDQHALARLEVVDRSRHARGRCWPPAGPPSRPVAVVIGWRQGHRPSMACVSASIPVPR